MYCSHHRVAVPIIEGAGLPSTQQLQPIKTSKLIFNTKNSNSGRHIVFKKYRLATKRKIGGIRTKLTTQHTFTDNERYQLQSYRVNYIQLNSGIRLKSSCTPAVNTVPLDGRVKSSSVERGGAYTSARNALFVLGVFLNRNGSGGLRCSPATAFVGGVSLAFFFCRSLPFDPSFSCPHRGCVLFTSQGSCSYQRGFLAANHPAASANQNVPLIFRATNSNSGRHVFLAVTLQHSNRHRTQNHYAFHQSRQYYLLVRSKLVRKEARLRVQRETLRCIAAALYLSVQAASQCLVSHQPCLILQKTKGRFSFSEQEPTSTAFLNEWRV